MSFSIIIKQFLGTETGHWTGRITIQAERVLLKQDSQCSSAMIRETGGFLVFSDKRGTQLGHSALTRLEWTALSTPPRGPLRPCGALRHNSRANIMLIVAFPLC